MVLTGHTFPVQALAFAPDGSTLTSAALFCTQSLKGGVEMTVWDTRTGNPTRKHRVSPGGVLTVALAPGGQMLAAAQEQTLVLWNVSPWQERPLESSPFCVCALAFSPDGSQLAATNSTNEVTLWEVASGKVRASCKGGPRGFVQALAFTPDGKTLASGDRDFIVRLWDPDTGRDRASLEGHTHPIYTLAFSPDGQTLASGDYSGVVMLWDVTSGRLRATLQAQEDEITAVTFAPDGRTLATASGANVRLFDAATLQLLAKLEGHQGKVRCLAYSPDGTRLASGSYDQTVRLWDVAQYRAR